MSNPLAALRQRTWLLVLLVLLTACGSSLSIDEEVRQQERVSPRSEGGYYYDHFTTERGLECVAYREFITCNWDGYNE